MPLFDFQCRDCSETFEELVRHGEIPGCPKCDGSAVERLLPTVAVRTGSTAALSKRAAKARDARQSRDRMHERLRYENSHDRHG